MHARRTPATLLLLLSLCAMAGLLISPAALLVEAAAYSSAAAAADGDQSVVVDLDSPTDAPRAATAAATTPGAGTEYYAAVDEAVAAPASATTHRFRPRYDPALSPGAKRELEHEAHCGPRVPVRRGFPWPEWKPNCRSSGGGDPKPAAALLQRPWDEP